MQESVLGIAGIIATAIVGFTIFCMQKRADSRINRMIEAEHGRVASRKSFWIQLALEELEEVKKIHCQALTHIKDFPHKKADPQFTNQMRLFFMMANYAFMIRHLRLIQEAANRLIDLLDDTQLPINLRNWIEASGGPYYVMDEAYRRGEQYGSLDQHELSITATRSAIESHLETVVDLISRINQARNANDAIDSMS